MAEVEVKVPKGYKRCPKCKNLVKGPRTKVCTHDGCGHQFQPKKATKPVKAGKAAKPVKSKVKEEPQVPVIPDPFTKSEIVMCHKNKKNVAPQGVNPWTGYCAFNTFGVISKPNNTAKALRYVYGLPTVADVVVPDAVKKILV